VHLAPAIWRLQLRRGVKYLYIIHTHTHTHTNTHTHTYIRIYIHTYVYTYIYLYMYVYMYMYMCMYMCMYMHMYMHVCVCVCVCVCVYLSIYQSTYQSIYPTRCWGQGPCCVMRVPALHARTLGGRTQRHATTRAIPPAVPWSCPPRAQTCWVG
jgi:hypothetical protein